MCLFMCTAIHFPFPVLACGDWFTYLYKFAYFPSLLFTRHSTKMRILLLFTIRCRCHFFSPACNSSQFSSMWSILPLFLDSFLFSFIECSPYVQFLVSPFLILTSILPNSIRNSEWFDTISYSAKKFPLFVFSSFFINVYWFSMSYTSGNSTCLSPVIIPFKMLLILFWHSFTSSLLGLFTRMTLDCLVCFFFLALFPGS